MRGSPAPSLLDLMPSCPETLPTAMRQLAHNAEALVVALLMKMGAVLSKRAPLKKPHNPSRVAGTEAWRGAAGADQPRCSSLRYMTAAPRERQCCRAYLAETVELLAET